MTFQQSHIIYFNFISYFIIPFYKLHYLLILHQINKIQIPMANKVTTQWFDLHVKHGNYLPNEKQKTLAQQQAEMQKKHEEQNKLQNVLDRKNQQQLQELQDDLDFDDQFTRQYMANRMAQIKQKAQKMKYGQVMEISRDQYIRQVTNAPAQDFVLLHLYQNSNQFCNLINQHLPAFAAKYGQVKFIKIIADKCIQKFPDANCPCFIIYKGGKPVSTIMNVDKRIKQKIQNINDLLKEHGIQPL